jgi:hypothetical protein
MQSHLFANPSKLNEKSFFALPSRFSYSTHLLLRGSHIKDLVALLGQINPVEHCASQRQSEISSRIKAFRMEMFIFLVVEYWRSQTE